MMNKAQEYINRVCEYRCIPQVPFGSKCLVNGKEGVIVDGNSSCNFQVRFENKRVYNCHPYWRMTIFNADGTVLYKSDQQ